MPTDVQAILKLEVPLVVLVDQREMNVHELMQLAPGAIIELPKESEDELDILVNNKPIGMGAAVKVGENFGVRITYTGDMREKLEAMAGGSSGDVETLTSQDAVDSLTEQLLAGQ